MQKIGIFYNPALFKNIQKLQSHIEFLRENGYQIFLLESQKHIELQNISYVQTFENIDLLVVLGGDGTILLASKLVLKESIPLLGFNHGKLGFLSECKKDEFETVFSNIRKGMFSIEERMVLECKLISQSDISYYALNDCVLYKGTYPKMLTFNIYGDDGFLFDIEADGIIVSTPTGSTGYNISAGGSIVFPQTDVCLLTPINPHNQFIKPFVFPGDIQLSIEYIKGDNNICVAIDGENIESIKKKDRILIRKSGYTSRFIKFPDKTFSKIVREKFID